MRKEALTPMPSPFADVTRPPPRYHLGLVVLFATLVVATSFSAKADFSGKVVGVSDGDTITVLNGRVQVKVRLVEIDAPEKAQPFGNRSKQALSTLIHGQEVHVVEKLTDRYGRTLGKVYRGNLDVNAEMVRVGMAWVYRKYASKKSPLFAVEAAARQARVGLWTDKDPIAPWEWRKSK